MTKVAIVGGGLLGLTLGLRLAEAGRRVQIFEAGPAVGGLASWHDYGPFTWDRFYHCILPQDGHLLELIRHLGLEADLVWRQTGTGYFGGGRAHSMSTTRDYLRFPLLSWIDKARVGATVAYAATLADPDELYDISAEQWLTRWCGKSGYEVFWRPLLKAKFGPFYDRVAAVFIWATLTRLFGARSGALSKEKLGYVRGGYRAILQRFQSRLALLGAEVHVRSPVVAVRPSASGSGCEVVCQVGHETGVSAFDEVYFTGPTQLARRVAEGVFSAEVDRVDREYPSGGAYLGVACLALALRRALTPFYVLNVGDESYELTGVIEMTNLVDRDAETAGFSLVYVPKYLGSDDPRLDASDSEIEASLMDRGLCRLFPELRPSDVVYQEVHRTRFVQPLPLVGHGARVAKAGDGRTSAEHSPRPFRILNTSMLTCATLNNDEVVAFVDRFVAKLPVAPSGERSPSAPAGARARSLPWSNGDRVA